MGRLKDSASLFPHLCGANAGRNQSPRDGQTESSAVVFSKTQDDSVAISLPEMGRLKGEFSNSESSDSLCVAISLPEMGRLKVETKPPLSGQRSVAISLPEMGRLIAAKVAARSGAWG